MKTILLLLLAYPLFAQNFQYQAQVGPVPKSGYYRLNLSPDIVGRLNTGLGDIRLYGTGTHDVPYLLTRQMGTDASTLVPFAVITKSDVPGKWTAIVVQRPAGAASQSLSVEFKNANVLKRATLSGSNDQQTWYALDDHVQLGTGEARRSTATTTVQTILFPPVDYTYLRLVVSDSASAPLNLLRLGSYNQTSTATQYTPVAGLRFTQRDSSDRYTYLRIQRPAPARLDRLTIRVRTSAPFRRQVEIGQLMVETVGRKRRRQGITRSSFAPLMNGVLSSAGDSTWQLPGLSTENLYLRIANDDNPPLPIQAIAGAQITTYLTANLLADSTYRLRFGDKTVARPVYDLTAIRSQIAGTLPTATVGAITAQANASKSGKQTNRGYMLWGVMAAVLVLLGVMTYSLLGGVSKRQQTQ